MNDIAGQPMKRGLVHKRWYHMIDRRDDVPAAATSPGLVSPERQGVIALSQSVGSIEDPNTDQHKLHNVIDPRDTRLRYVWTEYRGYRVVLLLICALSFVWFISSKSLTGQGMRDQVDLCKEGLLICPNTVWGSEGRKDQWWTETENNETLRIRVQGCAITWTPTWFNTCNRTANDRPEGNKIDSKRCETHNTKHSFRRWWKGNYYDSQASSSVSLPFKFFNARTWFKSNEEDYWGEHQHCPYCVGIYARSHKAEFESKANKGRLAWKVINDSTTLGPTLVIGPEVQPSNPDVFAAPPICYVTIPYPPPRHLHIDVGGHHNFKTRIYAANQSKDQNPRVVTIQAKESGSAVLVDFHAVNLDRFTLGGELIGDGSNVLPQTGPDGMAAKARVQMTNVSIQELHVSVHKGYADISTHEATTVEYLESGSVCVAGATVGTPIASSGVVLAHEEFKGHTAEHNHGLPAHETIEDFIQQGIGWFQCQSRSNPLATLNASSADTCETEPSGRLWIAADLCISFVDSFAQQWTQVFVQPASGFTILDKGTCEWETSGRIWETEAWGSVDNQLVSRYTCIDIVNNSHGRPRCLSPGVSTAPCEAEKVNNLRYSTMEECVGQGAATNFGWLTRGCYSDVTPQWPNQALCCGSDQCSTGKHVWLPTISGRCFAPYTDSTDRSSCEAQPSDYRWRWIGQGVQQFVVKVVQGDASVNVWSKSTSDGKYLFEVYENVKLSKRNNSGYKYMQRELKFDPAEMQAIVDATTDITVDILDVRVGGPGYLMMDAAYSKYINQDGFLGDQIFSHDMPMRSGPWGLTRRPPINWHTSQVEPAAFSAGTVAARTRDGIAGKETFDLTMTHGFCPTFHKVGVVCTELSALSTSLNIRSCESSLSDSLLQRDHRYSCNPAWGSGVFSLIWFLRAEFTCKTPFEASSPYSLDRDFAVEKQVYSGMKNANLPDAPLDPVTMRWGLSWDTFEWGFFHFDRSLRESSIESTENIKLLSSWMMLIMWYGAAAIILLFAFTVHKFFRESVAQFKLELLMIDEKTRSFAAKILPAMELDRLDENGDAKIDHDEILKFKPFIVQDIITHKWVSDAEMFIYRQLVDNNLNVERKSKWSIALSAKMVPTCKKTSTKRGLLSLIFNCKCQRSSQENKSLKGIQIKVNVTETALEELVALTSFTNVTSTDADVYLDAEEVFTCLERLRLLTTYVGMAHILENVIPHKLPYEEHPNIPEALYFQATHPASAERNAVLLQAGCILIPPTFIAMVASGLAKYFAAFSFNISDQFAVYFQKWTISPVCICCVYFCWYNFTGTGFDNPKCHTMRHMNTEDRKQVDETALRRSIIKARVLHFVTALLQLACLVIFFWAGMVLIVFAELTLLGVFLYPARCMPYATSFIGLAVNAFTLKKKLIMWFKRIEDEIKEAMECVQDCIGGMQTSSNAATMMREELSSLSINDLLRRAEAAKLVGVSELDQDNDGDEKSTMKQDLIDLIVANSNPDPPNITSSSHTTHPNNDAQLLVQKTLGEILKQQAVGTNFEMIRSFQRQTVAAEQVSDLLRQFGLTKSIVVTTILSATVSLMLVCAFLILAHHVATRGSSQTASAITSFLIAISVGGSNRINDPETKEQQFINLKKRIIRFYYDQQTKTGQANFVFNIHGNASTTLGAASAHYENLKTKSKERNLMRPQLSNRPPTSSRDLQPRAQTMTSQVLPPGMIQSANEVRQQETADQNAITNTAGV